MIQTALDLARERLKTDIGEAIQLLFRAEELLIEAKSSMDENLYKQLSVQIGNIRIEVLRESRVDWSKLDDYDWTHMLKSL